MTIKYEEGIDGFVLFITTNIKDEEVTYTITVQDEAFELDGKFNVDFDDKHLHLEQEIEDEAVLVLSNIIKELIEQEK